MTKDEYLKQLRNNIQSLTIDEQEEAIRFYTDYFEESENDDEQIISELGSPEELSKKIIENFANALVAKKADVKEEKSNQNDKSSYENIDNDSLYFAFKKSSVKNLKMDLKAADIVLIPGEKYIVETRGVEKDAFSCCLKNDGTLVIRNENRLNFNFFSHNRNNHLVQRILITIPRNAVLDKFQIQLGAGNLQTKDISITCQKGHFDVGAGNLVLKSVTGGKIDYRCGMGNITFNGKITGISNIDCGMGNITLNLQGDPETFSYDAKIGMGDFRINGEKKSGICQVLDNERKQNHISVNCGMGSVNIKLNK